MKIITIKPDTTFSNYFTVSKFLSRWIGLMKWYQVPNVWSKVTSNRKYAKDALWGAHLQRPLVVPCLLPPPRYFHRPQGAVKPTLGTTGLKVQIPSSFNLVYLFVLSLSVFFVPSFLRHYPSTCVLVYSLSYLLITLQNYVPPFLTQDNGVLIDTFHTEQSC
jgi:hypothetical protein